MDKRASMPDGFGGKGSGFAGMDQLMAQMMGLKNYGAYDGRSGRSSAGLRGPAAPAAPAAPLLGSLASSYFKKPQAGLATPPAAGGPPMAGLQPMGNRARGEASWVQRYGVKPKWATLPQG